MAGTVEQKLNELGITLHAPNPPVANYVGFVRTGNLLFVSGQVCNTPEGKLIAKGKLGAGVTVEQGAAAARGCAVNLLAQVKMALGDLDKVARVVRLGGFVNSMPDFIDGPKVLNGASDLMVAAFGELEGSAVAAQPGRHRLVPDELQVLVAAVRQRHHEGPGASGLAIGVQQDGAGAEVHLGSLARGEVQSAGDLWRQARHQGQEILCAAR